MPQLPPRRSTALILRWYHHCVLNLTGRPAPLCSPTAVLAVFATGPTSPPPPSSLSASEVQQPQNETLQQHQWPPAGDDGSIVSANDDRATTSSGTKTATLELPLHSKYPAAAWGATNYVDVALPRPWLLVRRISASGNNGRSSSAAAAGASSTAAEDSAAEHNDSSAAAGDAQQAFGWVVAVAGDHSSSTQRLANAPDRETVPQFQPCRQAASEAGNVSSHGGLSCSPCCPAGGDSSLSACGMSACLPEQLVSGSEAANTSPLLQTANCCCRLQQMPVWRVPAGQLQHARLAAWGTLAAVAFSFVVIMRAILF